MAELHWPRRATFVEHASDGVDSEERRYVGPGVYDVPDEMVDQYLERGWERPEDSGADAPEAVDQEPEPEAEAEDDGFDAAGFVDGSWQAVVASIEDGEADGHLDAVEAAERDRDGDPRTSVIEAVEDRAG